MSDVTIFEDTTINCASPEAILMSGNLSLVNELWIYGTAIRNHVVEADSVNSFKRRLEKCKEWGI